MIEANMNVTKICAVAVPGGAAATSTITITVIICTRDRGTLIEATLTSILTGTRRPDELLVVDQSDGRDTRDAVERIAAREDVVRYLPTPTRGLSRARNVGLEQSRGGLIVFTDDDVVAEQDWLTEIAREFQTYPRLAFLFGTVLPPDGYDWETEKIPYSRVPTKRPVRWFQKEVFGGMGANMALRRTTFEQIGGFDAMLGAGTEVAGCEDYEYALRCVCFRPSLEMHTLDEARVVHHAGARSGPDYHAFVHQVNGTGMGLFCAYLLRTRSLRYKVKAVQSLLTPLGVFLGQVLRGRKPSGLRTYVYSLNGFAVGMKRPLEGSNQA